MLGLDAHSELFGGFATVVNKLVKLKAALWVGRVLSAIGLGFVAQDFIYEPLIQQAITAWNSVPGEVAMWVHVLGIDQGISLLLSAYGIRGASRIFMTRMASSGAPA